MAYSFRNYYLSKVGYNFLQMVFNLAWRTCFLSIFLFYPWGLISWFMFLNVNLISELAKEWTIACEVYC